MTKPRWRWATRDRYLPNCKYARMLWTRKPQWIEKAGQWFWPDERQTVHQYVTLAYARKRFGRDLRPGELRRLP